MQAFSCLMYHNVCSNGSLTDVNGEWAELSPSIKSYFVEVAAFTSQIAAIQKDVDLISLSRVKNFFASPVPRQHVVSLPDSRPSTLITFDDGWRGTLELAVPVLQRYAAEATVFITTHLLDTPGFLKASELHRLPPQLQVGSHGKTHGFLNEMTEAEIREELWVSKSELERLTGRKVSSVGIPNGAIDHRVRRIAGELGYESIFTSDVHLNSRWSGPTHIGRANIRSTTTVDAALQLALGNFGIEPIRRMVLYFPKRLLGTRRYRQMRAWWMGEKSSQKEMHDLCPSKPVYSCDPAIAEAGFQNSAAEATQPH